MALTETKIGHPNDMPFHHKKELYGRNSWMARSNPERTFAVNSQRLEGDHPNRMMRMTSPHFQAGAQTALTPDHRWFKSHATTFAKYGVYPGQGVKGMYMRDPHTGVWFKDTPKRLWHQENFVPHPSSVSKGSKDYVGMNSMSITLKRQPL
mmetsp:Transcript_84320/g.149033  ORF Transcript_84320/g.149033 Transcript_84320/m.149033 type:complete len:151 (+) Transcript_84320:98-550(+)|eukprot:CAMPEP_0197643726 /NCGR_PEP_ID=MMETSP1338-20131121/16943_1 /TAXON_ID=43686 ORGANISM="Pelagodinium beii, Strain RCC1491" /NCGR_SAMPLE_ID=MMETSP1338 /ASSEMBLY_ACC=CAM_ASM_000754 /LENGTH=150 /DNA_ID=CAMNT_0043217011 /DNA_START=99 /DNA_END=551 /DNA_ORIENTATION=+